MARSSKNKSLIKKPKELTEEAKMDGKLPGRNISEQSEIEQTRVEYRRAADLDDKRPAGDGGPEDANEGEERQEQPNY